MMLLDYEVEETSCYLRLKWFYGSNADILWTKITGIFCQCVAILDSRNALEFPLDYPGLINTGAKRLAYRYFCVSIVDHWCQTDLVKVAHQFGENILIEAGQPPKELSHPALWL